MCASSLHTQCTNIPSLDIKEDTKDLVLNSSDLELSPAYVQITYPINRYLTPATDVSGQTP